MYRLFIADDEKSVITGLQRNIKWEQLGIRICGTALSGSEAFSQIQKLNPDFALLDIRMPEMTGLEIIERLKGKVDTLFLVFSGYDEFDYVKEAMDLDVVGYLLKPSRLTDIEKAFVKAIERRHNLSLIDRYYDLSHNQQDQMEVDPDFSDFMQLFPGLRLYAAFFCIRVSFPRRDFLSAYFTTRKALLAIRSDFYQIFPFQMNGGIGLIVAFLSADALGERQKEAISAIESALNEQELQVYFGIGSTAFLPSEISGSMKKATVMMTYSMFSEESGNWTRLSGQNDEAVSEKIREFTGKIIDVQNDLDLKEEISNLLHALMNGNLSVEQIKWICADMIHDIHHRILNEHNIELNKVILQDDFAQNFFSCTKMEALQEQLYGVLLSIREYIDVYQQGRKSVIINQMKQYIQSNLDKRLSLEDLEAEFYLNTSYISYIFKKETGTNLFTYITDLRIAKAQNLLRNTNMKIADIALQSGYHDQRYFCQVFKQKCGVTASEYRELRP